MKKIFVLCLVFILISGCKTVTKKVDEASIKETEKLSKFLKKTETELKIEFGEPDSISVEKKLNLLNIYLLIHSYFQMLCLKVSIKTFSS